MITRNQNSKRTPAVIYVITNAYASRLRENANYISITGHGISRCACRGGRRMMTQEGIRSLIWNRERTCSRTAVNAVKKNRSSHARSTGAEAWERAASMKKARMELEDVKSRIRTMTFRLSLILLKQQSQNSRTAMLPHYL